MEKSDIKENVNKFFFINQEPFLERMKQIYGSHHGKCLKTCPVHQNKSIALNFSSSLIFHLELHNLATLDALIQS